MATSELNAGCNPTIDQHAIQGGVEIFLVATEVTGDKLQPDGPLQAQIQGR